MGLLGARGHVILVLRECIWNELVVPLVLPIFDDTGSLDYPPHRVAYHPSASTRVNTSHSLAMKHAYPIVVELGLCLINK